MPKTALVTGANRGIGLEICRQLVERGDRVIAACRSVSNGLTSLDVQVEEGVDVSSEESVAHLVRRLGGQPIDWLINNAGVLTRETLSSMDYGAVRLQFEVNALGPLNVALAFRRRLHIGSRVINISSRLGSISDNESGDDYGYRMSKAAQNMLTSNLAIELGKEGICVVAMHPGIVATEMTGNQGTPADEVAGDFKRTIGGLEMARSGSFLDRFGEEIPW